MQRAVVLTTAAPAAQALGRKHHVGDAIALKLVQKWDVLLSSRLVILVCGREAGASEYLYGERGVEVDPSINDRCGRCAK